jgi:hypothetical protein
MMPTLYGFGMDLLSRAQDGLKCEVDFVFLNQRPDGRVELGVGEAKGASEISDGDVQNLRSIAKAIGPSRLDVFSVFAKAAEFTREEIRRCLEPAELHPRRTVLLARAELEPYSLHELLKPLPPHARFPLSLSDFANVSHLRYGSATVPDDRAGPETAQASAPATTESPSS